MKRSLFFLAAAMAFAVFGPTTAHADDRDALAGKWAAERTDAQGRAVKQVLEINKVKFKFQITRVSDERTLYAEGDVKVEPVGPFKTAEFYSIQGGRSPLDLQSVDDDRTVVYTRVTAN